MPNSDWRQNDQYATYDSIMEDLANDRDDSLDPEFRDPDGYCEHGNYVGGSGPDLMCQWCEDGISVVEMRKYYASRRLRGIRENAENAQRFLNVLLVHGRVSGSDAADFAQRSSYVSNPLSRYGRH